jgi:hypothetical protein
VHFLLLQRCVEAPAVVGDQRRHPVNVLCVEP